MVHFLSPWSSVRILWLEKKGCSRGRCLGRRSRPPGKRKEDEAHFYIHFDIEISSSFYCLMVFCIVKNDVFSWPPVRGGGQNGLKTRNTIYLCCIKAIRLYDISFSEFSTKWLLSWKRNNFGKIELVRMVQIALKWQFCSKSTYISALLYLVVVATSIFCRNLWAESCDASNGIIVFFSSWWLYVLSWQAYILVENKKLGYFLNTQHQDYDE